MLHIPELPTTCSYLLDDWSVIRCPVWMLSTAAALARVHAHHPLSCWNFYASQSTASVTVPLLNSRVMEIRKAKVWSGGKVCLFACVLACLVVLFVSFFCVCFVFVFVFVFCVVFVFGCSFVRPFVHSSVRLSICLSVSLFCFLWFRFVLLRFVSCRVVRCWLVGWPVGRSVGWSVGWSVGRLVGCFFPSLLPSINNGCKTLGVCIFVVLQSHGMPTAATATLSRIRTTCTSQAKSHIHPRVAWCTLCQWSSCQVRKCTEGRNKLTPDWNILCAVAFHGAQPNTVGTRHASDPFYSLLHAPASWTGRLSTTFWRSLLWAKEWPNARHRLFGQCLCPSEGEHKLCWNFYFPPAWGAAPLPNCCIMRFICLSRFRDLMILMNSLNCMCASNVSDLCQSPLDRQSPDSLCRLSPRPQHLPSVFFWWHQETKPRQSDRSETLQHERQVAS